MDGLTRDVGGEASHTEKTFWYVANPACEEVLFRLEDDFVVQEDSVGEVLVELWAASSNWAGDGNCGWL